MKKYSILIIDDEKSQRDVLSGYLKKKGYTIFIAISGEDGIKIAKENLIDIILSDFKMPDMTGIEVLEEVKKMNPEISFIMITAFGTVENAVRAMRLGADDYISKPVDLDELDILIDKIIGHKDLKSENEMLKTQLQEKYRISAVISESPNMASVINIAVRVAESKATVLITGESGTGKK
jgi:DNA-binding NtrC family response regulator